MKKENDRMREDTSSMHVFDVLNEFIKAVERGEDVRKLLRFNEETSKMLLLGIEVAPLHDYFISSILTALEEQIGPVARTLVIRYAKEVGIKDGKAVKNAVFPGKNPSIKELERVVKGVVGTWCQMGWGKIVKFEVKEYKKSFYPLASEDEMVEYGVKEGYAVISRSTSYEAEGYLKLGKGFAKTPRCWIALGYTTGLLSGLLGRNVRGEETECIGKGDSRCTLEFKW